MSKKPLNYITSLQYDLFTRPLANDLDSVSSTLKFWDSIPKYFFTPGLVKKLRTEDGLARSYECEFWYNKVSHTVKIQPALIVQGDGVEKACFPSVTEELVEEVLKKILLNKESGIHDPIERETWVSFTLQKIKKELEGKGKGRNIEQIKRAINIMSSCQLVVSKSNKEIWSGSILSDVVQVDREKYYENTGTFHSVRLPLPISIAINNLEYRQLDYLFLMTCKKQLTRWLYKRLVYRYTYAEFGGNSYHFMFSDVKRDSALLKQATDRDNRKKMISTLIEMQAKGKIISYVDTEVKKGRKIIDVKYTVLASLDLEYEQKAANKRARIARSKI